MVWSPLASGFLSGKYTRNEPVPPDSRRAKFNFPPVDVEKGYAVVEKMNEIAEPYEASVPQIALAWLLAKPFVSTVILGANSVEQLQDNLEAANVVLAEEDVTILDDLTASTIPYPAWMQPLAIGSGSPIVDSSLLLSEPWSS